MWFSRHLCNFWQKVINEKTKARANAHILSLNTWFIVTLLVIGLLSFNIVAMTCGSADKGRTTNGGPSNQPLPDQPSPVHGNPIPNPVENKPIDTSNANNGKRNSANNSPESPRHGLQSLPRPPTPTHISISTPIGTPSPIRHSPGSQSPKPNNISPSPHFYPRIASPIRPPFPQQSPRSGSSPTFSFSPKNSPSRNNLHRHVLLKKHQEKMNEVRKRIHFEGGAMFEEDADDIDNSTNSATNPQNSSSQHPSPTLSRFPVPSLDAIVKATKKSPIKQQPSIVNPVIISKADQLNTILPIDSRDPFTYFRNLGPLFTIGSCDYYQMTAKTADSSEEKLTVKRVILTPESLPSILNSVLAMQFMVKAGPMEHIVEHKYANRYLIDGKDEIWFFYEFIVGADLLTIKNRRKQYRNLKSTSALFSEDELLSILHQVLHGLNDLHFHKIMHRDVKPENIFVCHDGTVKLHGLSLAYQIDDAKSPLNLGIVGTVSYIAPDMVATNPPTYDFKVDIWSLGITLYELMHGEVPFIIEKAEEYFRYLAYMDTFPLPFSISTGKQTDVDISLAMRKLLAAMLIVDPSKRPSAEKLLEHQSLATASIKLISFDHRPPLDKVKNEVLNIASFAKAFAEPVTRWGIGELYLYEFTRPEMNGLLYPVWESNITLDKLPLSMVDLCSRKGFLTYVTQFESNGRTKVIFDTFNAMPLSEFIENGLSIEECYLAEITAQFLEILIILQEKNLIHRNINPSNIYLTTDGDVILADYSKLISVEASGDGFTPDFEFYDRVEFGKKGFTLNSDVIAFSTILTMTQQAGMAILPESFSTALLSIDINLVELRDHEFLKTKSRFCIVNQFIVARNEVYDSFDVLHSIRSELEAVLDNDFDSIFPIITNEIFYADELGEIKKCRINTNSKLKSMYSRQIHLTASFPVAEFIREITFLRELNHPNIARIYRIYIIGSDLHVLYHITDDSKILSPDFTSANVTPEQFKLMIYEVLRGLEYLHSHRLAHGHLTRELIVTQFSNPSKSSITKLVDLPLLVGYRNNLITALGNGKPLISTSPMKDLSDFADMVVAMDSSLDAKAFAESLKRASKICEIYDHDYVKAIHEKTSSFYSILNMISADICLSSIKYDQLLGTGTFGKVYEAFVTTEKDGQLMTHSFAVKRQIVLSASDEGKCQQLKNELLNMKACQGPNVIKFQGLFWEDDSFLIVMEKMKDGDLYTVVMENNNIMTESELSSLFRQLLTGLANIHSKNIGHFDIKLENILVDGSRYVWADFGESREVGKISGKYGTRPYMAPEVLGNRQYDLKADIWSLGILAYVIWEQNFPLRDFSYYFNDYSYDTDIQTFDTTTLPYTRAHPDLKAFIEKCTKLDPVERPSVQELIASETWLKSVDQSMTTINTDNPVPIESIIVELQNPASPGNLPIRNFPKQVVDVKSGKDVPLDLSELHKKAGILARDIAARIANPSAKPNNTGTPRKLIDQWKSVKLQKHYRLDVDRKREEEERLKAQLLETNERQAAQAKTGKILFWGEFPAKSGKKWHIDDSLKARCSAFTTSNGTVVPYVQKTNIDGPATLVELLSDDIINRMRISSHLKLWWLFQITGGDSLAVRKMLPALGLNFACKSNLGYCLTYAFNEYVVRSIAIEFARLQLPAKNNEPRPFFLMLATLSEIHPKQIKISTVNEFGFGCLKEYDVDVSADQLKAYVEIGKEGLKKKGMLYYFPQ